MRKQTFAIRPVRMDDATALKRLFVASTVEECSRLAGEGDGALVAVDREVVVGVARWNRVGRGDEAEVAVFVAEPWRGRGVGSQLVDEAERRAASSGLHVSTSTMLGDAA